MTIRDVLQKLSFGQRVAEEENKELEKYFVETDQWRRIEAGQVDIVYGPKGSGKSALYSLLRARTDSFFDRSIVMVSAENPRGATAFRDLAQDPPTSEIQFVNLWKLYTLTLVTGVLQEYAAQDEDVKKIVKVFNEAGLVTSAERGLSAFLRSALDYVRRVSALETEVSIDPASAAPKLGFQILFHEPGITGSSQGQVSVDSLFQAANKVLERLRLTIWVLLDRLDVAFADSADLEANALRALFKVYLDLLGNEQIRLKIFLRTDIWRRITQDREFREASHITRSTTIKWDKSSLLNLVARRAAQSRELLDFCEIGSAESAVGDDRDAMFEKLLPDQVEVGPNKPRSFEWILGRTSDGTGETAPRELIHFLNTALEEELRRLDVQAADADTETIFSRSALKNALPEVSRVRLQQTLYAEYPELRPAMAALEEQKTLQRLDTLTRLWQKSEEEAARTAERLVEIGFFERQGTKEAPEYWVPFLYRPALKMVQGTAD